MNDKLKEKARAEKEIEAFQWMKGKGYDRKACKDLSPILVQYFAEQNTLTLESKVDENGLILAEPHECAEGYDVECECTGLCYGSDYANLPTIGQMPSIIRELREENKTLSEFCTVPELHLINQLEEKEQRIKELEEILKKDSNC